MREWGMRLLLPSVKGDGQRVAGDCVILDMVATRITDEEVNVRLYVPAVIGAASRGVVANQMTRVAGNGLQEPAPPFLNASQASG